VIDGSLRFMACWIGLMAVIGGVVGPILGIVYGGPWFAFAFAATPIAWGYAAMITDMAGMWD
jgi:hypothetical protein